MDLYSPSQVCCLESGLENECGILVALQFVPWLEVFSVVTRCGSWYTWNSAFLEIVDGVCLVFDFVARFGRIGLCILTVINDSIDEIFLVGDPLRILPQRVFQDVILRSIQRLMLSGVKDVFRPMLQEFLADNTRFNGDPVSIRYPLLLLFRPMNTK